MKLRRHFGTSNHVPKAHGVLHKDSVFTRNTEKLDLKFVLLFKSDLTSYPWLYPSAKPRSEMGTTYSTKCLSSPCFMVWPAFESQEHSSVSIMKQSAEWVHINQHFPQVYRQLKKSTVEKSHEKVLKIIKALLLAWELSPSHMPLSLDCIGGLINQPLFRRRNSTDDSSVWLSPRNTSTIKITRQFAGGPFPFTESFRADIIDSERLRPIVNKIILHNSSKNRQEQLRRGW